MIRFIGTICLGAALAVAQSGLALEPPGHDASGAVKTDSQDAGQRFLQRLAGQWEGEGVSAENKRIRDRMQLEWVLGARFLRMTYRALDGDDYASEGYLWYDAGQRHYVLWAANNGSWPVRERVGRRENDSLVLDDRNTPGLSSRLTFAFVDDDTLDMRESFVIDGKRMSDVVVRFHRTPGK